MENLGLVGFTGAGANRLFAALTGLAVPSEYEPAVAVASVPDERLDRLAAMSHSKKVVPAGFELVHLALPPGAKPGEGLGAKVLGARCSVPGAGTARSTQHHSTSAPSTRAPRHPARSTKHEAPKAALRPPLVAQLRQMRAHGVGRGITQRRGQRRIDAAHDRVDGPRPVEHRLQDLLLAL